MNNIYTNKLNIFMNLFIYLFIKISREFLIIKGKLTMNSLFYLSNNIC